MPAPELYTSEALDIDPNAIWTEAQTMVIEIGRLIAERVDGIHRVWENLTVGWVGDTSDEADAFNTEWNSALTRIFGTEADPKSGVLNQVATGIQIAAMNYAGTEDTVTKMFQEFTAALGQGSSDPNATPDPNRDIDTGPIHENTPQT
jgi:hypothetical protein